jgi:hypothetical protein
MVSFVVALAMLLVPIALIAGPLVLANTWQRRRARVIARQIRLTDAVHAEMGAVVAPLVEKPAFRPWRVVFPIYDERAPELGRLITIAERVVGAELPARRDLEIVFTHAA